MTRREIDPQSCFAHKPQVWTLEHFVESYARLIAEQESLRQLIVSRKISPDSFYEGSWNATLDFYEYERDLIETLQGLFGFEVVHFHEWEGTAFYSSNDYNFDSIVRHYNRVRQDIFGVILVGRLSDIELQYRRELSKLQGAHADHLKSILVDIARTWPTEHYGFDDNQLAEAGFDPTLRLRPDPRGFDYIM